MIDCLIKKLPYNLNSHAGLAIFGKYLKRIDLDALVDPGFPVRSGVAYGDILKSYLGLGVWARATLTGSRTFGAKPSSFAPWACALFLRVLRCTSVWTPMLLSGLIWPLK